GAAERRLANGPPAQALSSLAASNFPNVPVSWPPAWVQTRCIGGWLPHLLSNLSVTSGSQHRHGHRDCCFDLAETGLGKRQKGDVGVGQPLLLGCPPFARVVDRFLRLPTPKSPTPVEGLWRVHVDTYRP